MIFIFSDASFYKNVSTSAFYIHNTYTNQKIIDHVTFTDSNSFLGELYGVIYALEKVIDVFSNKSGDIVFYCDNSACRIILNDMSRGKAGLDHVNKRQKNKYMSQNAHLYANLERLSNSGMNLHVKHAPAHREKMNVSNTPQIRTIEGIKSLAIYFDKYIISEEMYSVVPCDPLVMSLFSSNIVSRTSAYYLFYDRFKSEFNSIVDILSRGINRTYYS